MKSFFSLVLLVLMLNVVSASAASPYWTDTAIRHYQQQINSRLHHFIQQHQEQAIVIHDVPSEPPVNKLKIKSRRLKPGKVINKRVHLPELDAPIFLVGDDALSRQWLEANQRKLLALKAIGFVVNVEGLDRLEALREIAPELSLMPVPADYLANILHIQHYPVLIFSDHITQQVWHVIL